VRAARSVTDAAEMESSSWDLTAIIIILINDGNICKKMNERIS
jgi:hypothetical protein